VDGQSFNWSRTPSILPDATILMGSVSLGRIEKRRAVDHDTSLGLPHQFTNAALRLLEDDPPVLHVPDLCIIALPGIGLPALRSKLPKAMPAGLDYQERHQQFRFRV